VLQGSHVVLRPLRASDIDELERIFATPEVSAWWVGIDRASIQAELLDGADERVTVYAIDVGGQVVGIVQSDEEPDEEYRQAGLDIAVAPEWHGTGVALDALRTLAAHLFETRHHHHLTIDPAAANGRAIAAYTKLGFRPVGVLRENERGADGSYHDTLLMDLLHGELR
jgi:aminoglycoside 6'-N-acetyltransferase